MCGLLLSVKVWVLSLDSVDSPMIKEVLMKKKNCENEEVNCGWINTS